MNKLMTAMHTQNQIIITPSHSPCLYSLLRSHLIVEADKGEALSSTKLYPSLPTYTRATTEQFSKIVFLSILCNISNMNRQKITSVPRRTHFSPEARTPPAPCNREGRHLPPAAAVGADSSGPVPVSSSGLVSG